MAFSQTSYNLHTQTWELGDAETGEGAIPPEGLGLASVQVAGTFGGATVALEVSNDGTNWLPLNDLAGDAISVTSAGLHEFSSAAGRVRAKTTGGTGTDVTVTLCAWG